MKDTRILIADDHAVVRRGLRSLLEAQTGWEVCAEAETGREAVDVTRKMKPDIVVMDVNMPEMNGLEAAREILKAAPQTEILVMTVYESPELVRELLDAGVRGYLLKSDAGSELVAAVDALRHHKSYFTSRVSEIVLSGFLKEDKKASALARDESPKSRLTRREHEIVQLLAEGKSNKEVAVALNISVKTAETHRANIMNKLGLKSISELVRYAVRHNIVQA